ncbi:MAG: hypothetical protein K6F91_10360 [Ruminococcus sp.]|nr:hypothetical protein [Ruminococcus sp.]
MFNIKKIPLILAAAVLALSMASCDKSSGGSSSTETPRSTVKPPVEPDESVTDNSGGDAAVQNENHIGEHLNAAYEILSGNKYTYKCSLSAPNIEKPVQIERYKSGSKLYQSQQTSAGKRGFLSDGSKVYEFDYLTYSYTDEGIMLPDVIESVVKANLPQSSTHIAAKDGEVAEEYTYMGDTYITVYDFYFDEKNGSLKRYTSTYSVEGQDDYVEERTVTELSSSIGDENVLNPTFTTTLTDFSAFSSADRQTYCMDQCEKFGIDEQKLVSNGMTIDSFKKITYNDFLGLIYRYADSNGGKAK